MLYRYHGLGGGSEPAEGRERTGAGGGEEEAGMMEGDGNVTRANNPTHLGYAKARHQLRRQGGPTVGAKIGRSTVGEKNEGELIYQLHR